MKRDGFPIMSRNPFPLESLKNRQRLELTLSLAKLVERFTIHTYAH